MPREQWDINPEEYDDFKKEIAQLSLSANYVIKGGPGSGKTLLALDRAAQIRNAALAADPHATPDFTFIVYTKALKQFIKSGANNRKVSLDNLVYHNEWDKAQVDYMIIDEAQDFSMEQIEEFFQSKRKSIMLYGDSEQQLYQTTLRGQRCVTIEEIEAHYGLQHKELKKNYRLPQLIASFAEDVIGNTTLAANCERKGTEKPKIIQFDNWQQELNYIMKEIKDRNYTDVGILLPFNTNKEMPRYPECNGYRNIQTVKQYFDDAGFLVQYKMDADTTLNFDSDVPKVMSYHSAKGLQFETVFIPFCDYKQDKFMKDNYTYPLYVALTRPYGNLIITHSSDLTGFLSGISDTKYDRLI